MSTLSDQLPIGFQATIGYTTYKIGLRGMLFHWDGEAWIRTHMSMSDFKKEVERQRSSDARNISTKAR